MKDSSNSLLEQLEAAFSRIRDQIELNEVMVEGELAIIKEYARPGVVFAPIADEGADDLIEALRNHQSAEWQEVHSTIEMALVRGRAEGASHAMNEIASAVQKWWSSR
jgi:hypothetical protein